MAIIEKILPTEADEAGIDRYFLPKSLVLESA
jgi:hypothetical protein